MGCVWFMYVYRKIELGYWWKHDDVKKKFLNEKCSLMLRALEYLFERYIFCAVWGFPNCPDVVKGHVLLSPCSEDCSPKQSFFKTKTFHSRLSFTVIFMDIAASQTSSCTAARLTPKWHRWATLSRSDFFLGWCRKRLVLTSASTGT